MQTGCRLHAGARSGSRTSSSFPTIDVRRRRARTRPTGIFTTGELPRCASTAQLTDARELYAVLTGRVNVDRRRAAARTRPRPVRVPRSRRAARAAARLRLLRRRHVAVAAEHDPQPRPALRAAAAVLPAEQQLLEGDDRGRVRTSRACAVTAAATCSSPASAGRSPRVPCSTTRAKAPTTPTATTSRRTSASRGRSGGMADSSGSILGRAEGDSVLRAGYTLGYNRPGMSDFTGTIDDNPGISQTGEPQPHNRQPRHPGLDPLPQPGDLGPPADLPLDARLSDDRRRHRRHHDVRPEPPGAVLADVDGRLAAQADQRHGHRGALRRHALAPAAGRPTTTTRSTSSRTAS